MEINGLLKLMVRKGASDLHLRVPSPPVLRISGQLITLKDLPPVAAKDVEMVFEHITTPEQRSTFLKELDLDFAYSVPELARFRVSVMRQRGTISIAFRMVPFKVFTIDELGLPQICKELILEPKGLILVTGPNGSGKSTTIAAIIDYLNENVERNVVIIEAPIEYLHSNKKCIIAQRDIGSDAKAFDIALAQSLHHDPDVIVVSEMRDMATISTAIRAAETGRLIVGSLHTRDAAQAIENLIDTFPLEQQPQIRLQLSQVMVAVLSQTLLPRASGKGRVAAFEVMIANPEVRELIREGKTFELSDVLKPNANHGMQTLEQALAELVKMEIVTKNEALMRSSYPERLKKLLQGRKTHV
jgi:twitching motility protein PilT